MENCTSRTSLATLNDGRHSFDLVKGDSPTEDIPTGMPEVHMKLGADREAEVALFTSSPMATLTTAPIPDDTVDNLHRTILTVVLTVAHK